MYQRVVFSTNLIGSACACGQVSIPRAVDHDTSTNHNGTGFGLEHDTRRALIADDVTGKRVEKKMHAGFVQQIQSDQLEYFGIEKDDVAGLQ